VGRAHAILWFDRHSQWAPKRIRRGFMNVASHSWLGNVSFIGTIHGESTVY
jgi:hypothetical protein